MIRGGMIGGFQPRGNEMKRTIGALMTAAAVVGCQSTGGNWQGSTTYSHPQQMQGGQMAPTAMSQAAKPASDSGIQLVGHNTGWGAQQNRTYRERVAAAVPSHGGMAPGFAAGMQGGMMGHGGPGCGIDGGMGMGMGGMGMGGPGGLGPRFSIGRTQIRFVKPTGMKIAWQDGSGGFTPPQLEAPARYNFMQARIYRLKISDIQNRPGVDLYPSLEVYPSNGKADAFLSHNSVPIELTDEDFEQVMAGNYVTKVIYLPDAKYQEMAIAGVETLVSTRLDPGVDPVQEAHRRGSILAVVRIGAVDLEMSHSPSLLQRDGMLPPGAMVMMGPATNVASTPAPGKMTITPAAPATVQIPSASAKPLPTLDSAANKAPAIK